MNDGAGRHGLDGRALRPWLHRRPGRRRRQLRRHGAGPGGHGGVEQPGAVHPGHRRRAAGLVDTLNGPGPFTIFAPANDAFAKIAKATLDAVLADPKGVLTKILTYHVVAGEKLDADSWWRPARSRPSRAATSP